MWRLRLSYTDLHSSRAVVVVIDVAIAKQYHYQMYLYAYYLYEFQSQLVLSKVDWFAINPCL